MNVRAPVFFSFDCLNTDTIIPLALIIENTANAFRVGLVSNPPGKYRVYDYLTCTAGGGAGNSLYMSDEPRRTAGSLFAEARIIAKIQTNVETFYPLIRAVNSNCKPASGNSDLHFGIDKWFCDAQNMLSLRWISVAGFAAGTKFSIQGRCFESESYDDMMCVYLGL